MNANLFRFTFFLACAMVAAIASQAILRAAARPSPAQAIRKAMTGDPLTQTELLYNLQFIDAQAFGPTINGGLSDTPSPSGPLPSGTVEYQSRSGALADGLSVLVIRLIPPFPSGQPSPAAAVLAYPVTFKISDWAGDPASVIGSISAAMPTLPAPIGGAASVAGAKPQFSITIPAGQPAVVYYCPPEQYKFLAKNPSGSPVIPGDPALTTLQNAQINVDASSATQDLAAGPLDVVRPQVILVHGVGSAPSTWGGFINSFTLGAAAILPKGQFVMADYSDNNTGGYNENAGVVPDRIDDCVLFDRFPAIRTPTGGPAIAATRVDVIGHSMGGVLTAWYAWDFGQINVPRADGFPNGLWNPTLKGADWVLIRANDFGVGDIRRFISIGSPFQGSPVADLFCTEFNSLAIKLIIAGIPGASGDGTAAWDLQTVSTATADIDKPNGPKIEWLPIAGLAGPNHGVIGQPWSSIYTALNIQPGNVLGLGPNNSDLIVAETSAEDGAGIGLKADVVQNVVHTDETGNANIANDVRNALDFEATGGSGDFNTHFSP